MNTAREPGSKGESFEFRLFVAGDEPHSRTARDNLREICESHISGPCEVEVVDILDSFDIALENNIFLTPALIKVSPRPPITIFGDLSDTRKVLAALKLA